MPDKISMKLGSIKLRKGAYTAQLIVYDDANENGVVWGSFPVSVKGCHSQ